MSRRTTGGGLRGRRTDTELGRRPTGKVKRLPGTVPDRQAMVECGLSRQRTAHVPDKRSAGGGHGIGRQKRLQVPAPERKMAGCVPCRRRAGPKQDRRAMAVCGMLRRRTNPAPDMHSADGGCGIGRRERLQATTPERKMAGCGLLRRRTNPAPDRRSNGGGCGTERKMRLPGLVAEKRMDGCAPGK